MNTGKDSQTDPPAKRAATTLREIPDPKQVEEDLQEAEKTYRGSNENAA
jgi:hypothetical protein